MAPHSPTSILSREQNAALFDILTHYETYREITAFKFPDAVCGYGFPFGDASAPGGTDEVLEKDGDGDCDGGDGDGDANGGDPNGHVDGQKDHEREKQTQDQHLSTAPLLQLLLTKLLLPMPGLRDLPRAFWSVRLETLLARLGSADLSESYDKSALGTRKVLATGASAVLEMLGRGLLGGLRGDGAQDGDEDEGRQGDGDRYGDGDGYQAGRKGKQNARHEHGEDRSDENNPESGRYDLAKADDLYRAWDNVLHALVYGDLADRLFGHFVESDDLEAFGPMVEASTRHNIFHLATLIHHIFVLSPEGQYLLKLIENVQSLIPYKMIRQTLRVGNAATMINGMMRILLAKLSVTSVTNWFGLTQNPDDGMNLVQRIISLVLSWDANDFRKSADKIEDSRSPDAPTGEMLRLIREYIEESRSHHESVRSASQHNEQSIMTEIFNASSPQINDRLTEAQHAKCLEYYSSLLSVRDRDRITDVFCRQPPDMFTQAMKDMVAAYTPMIRTVHASIDLRDHFDALRGFVEDFIKTSRPKDKDSTPYPSSEGKKQEDERRETFPSVEDYVALLMRHRHAVYKWVHALARQCPDIWESFRIYANETLVQFQKKNNNNSKDNKKKSCAPVSSVLHKLYAALDPDTQTEVRAAIDRHVTYLSTLNFVSQARMQYLVTESGTSGGSTAGPGVYLSRWQSLLDETPITPLQRKGPVRRGKDVKHTATMGKTGVGGNRVGVEEEAQTEVVSTPDVRVVVDALGEAFRREMGRRA
ncbi:hypothetical protein E4U21_001880 [Claviceps maximensis]|nr:hypothetical protein E4U21_001880 [Claviceps maximensis]